MEHREGPDPALDDPRGRALRLALPTGTGCGARIDRTTLLHPAACASACVSPPFRIAPPRWTAEPTFDLDFHLRRMRLAGPGTSARCSTRCSRSRPSSFDRARPLWEFTLFEGLDGPDGERAAFAMKVHHSVTDGVGGMALLAHFVDLAPDAAEAARPRRPGRARARGRRACSTSCAHSLAHTRRRALGIARRVPADDRRTRRPRASAIPIGTASDVAAHDPLDRPHARARDEPDVAGHARRGLGRRLDAFDVSARRPASASPRRPTRSLNDVFVAAVDRRRAPLPRAPRRRARSSCA